MTASLHFCLQRSNCVLDALRNRTNWEIQMNDFETPPLCGQPATYDRKGLDAAVAVAMIGYKPPEVTMEQICIPGYQSVPGNPHHVTLDELTKYG